MRKRDDIDYRRLAELLSAWENASLSHEGESSEESELDDAVYILSCDSAKYEEFTSAYPGYADLLDLYIGLKEDLRAVASACVSDQDYDLLKKDADDFITVLASEDKHLKRRNRFRIADVLSTAACVALVLMTILMRPNVNDTPLPATDNKIAATSVVSTAPQEPEPETVTAVTAEPQKGANYSKTVKAEAIKEVIKKEKNSAPVSAWDKFMAMRAEMAEVVNPGKDELLCYEFPDLWNPDIATDCESIIGSVYEGLDNAGKMYN